MFFTNLLKHVWGKVYLNIDLPSNRGSKCSTFTLGSSFIEFIFPTTKRKNDNNGWLKLYKKKWKENKAVAVWLVATDVLLWIPRLGINLIKLGSEFLLLVLRELAYAAFNTCIEKINSATGVEKGFFQFLAMLCWALTSLFSFVYFLGCYVTSPAITILATYDICKQLKPFLGGWAELIAVLLGVSIFVCQMAAIIFLLPLALPVVAAQFIAACESGFEAICAIFGILIVSDFAGFIYNNNPNEDTLFDRYSLLGEKKATLSIAPDEFLKIFSPIENLQPDHSITPPENKLKKSEDNAPPLSTSPLTQPKKELNSDYSPHKCTKIVRKVLNTMGHENDLVLQEEIKVDKTIVLSLEYKEEDTEEPKKELAQIAKNLIEKLELAIEDIGEKISVDGNKITLSAQAIPIMENITEINFTNSNSYKS